jgi:glucose/arabinose dehydrogenase
MLITSIRRASSVFGCLTLLGLLFPATTSAETISVTATHDGTIYESATNAESSGVGPTMFVGRILQSGQYLRRGLVSFNVADALPEGAKIQDVQLTMNLSRTPPDFVSTTLSLHRAEGAWGEGASNAGALGGLGTDAKLGDATWLASSYPSTLWLQPGGDFADVASASVNVSDLGPVDWTSTPALVADIQSWIDDPTSNHGWFIVGDELQPGSAVRLDTRENANPAVRPTLTVTYSVSVPEPGSALLLGFGALGCLLRRCRWFSGIAAFVALLVGMAAHAQAQPDLLPSVPLGSMKLRLTRMAEGLNGPVSGTFQYAPTDMVFAPGDPNRYFIQTLGGVVRTGRLDTGLSPDPYINLFSSQSSILPDAYGMTAVVMHPDFANSGTPGYGKFYTLEPEKRDTATPSMPASLNGKKHHQTALYEYTANDPAASQFQGTRRELMRVDEPGTIHNMNELVFGPDGYLYVSGGDGCNEANGSGTLCSDNGPFLGNTYGKVMRIDPLAPALTPGSNDPVSANGAYRTAASNPFANTSGALPEIFAYGLRNPYRLTFDRANGEIYVGDVGQRNIESVEHIVAGGNYGWNQMEGTFLYDKTDQNELILDEDVDGDGVGDFAAAHGLREPVFQYDHQDGKSVVGGYVYRGALFPELQGKYVYGDFRGPLNLFESRMFLGDLETGDLQELQFDSAGEQLPDLIYAFTETPDGELLVLGGANDGSTGEVFRITRATPFGDTDGDGIVGIGDLNNVRNNFGATGLGDTNLDGKVDISDLNAVRNNFGASTVGANTVPEPSTSSLFGIAALACCYIARRR